MLKAAEGSGSSFRLGITNNDISINDYEPALFPCQARLAQPEPESRSRAKTGQTDMRVRLSGSNAAAFTNEGKLVPKPTGYEHKKLSPAFARPREPNFRPAFERTSDPQIPLTRPFLDSRGTEVETRVIATYYPVTPKTP